MASEYFTYIITAISLNQVARLDMSYWLALPETYNICQLILTQEVIPF